MKRVKTSHFLEGKLASLARFLPVPVPIFLQILASMSLMQTLTLQSENDSPDPDMSAPRVVWLKRL
jgi:hypothetical protein